MVEITDFKILSTNEELNEKFGIPAGDENEPVYSGAEIEGYLFEKNDKVYFKVTQDGCNEYVIDAEFVEKLIF